MQSKDITQDNIDKIANLFPNCFTEHKDKNGNTCKAIDFEQLKSQLSQTTVVVSGDSQRYTLNWPDKKESILLANQPTNKTLRAVVTDQTIPTALDTKSQPYASSGSCGRDGTQGKFDSQNLYLS